MEPQSGKVIATYAQGKRSWVDLETEHKVPRVIYLSSKQDKGLKVFLVVAWDTVALEIIKNIIDYTEKHLKEKIYIPLRNQDWFKIFL